MNTVTIRIGGRAKGAYPLTLEADDGSAPVQAAMPAGDLDLPRLRSTLLDPEGEPPDLAETGRLLYEHLHQGEVGARWDELAREEPLRTLLAIEDSELRRLPWELLDDGHSRFATREDRPLMRVFGESATSPARPCLSWPLRVLIVVGIASAPGARKVGVEPELEELPHALRTVVGLVDVERLILPSRDALKKAIRSMHPHVLHVIAHGTTDEDGAPCLHMERGGEDDDWDWTSRWITEDLATSSAGRRLPRLVVLNACRSAEPGVPEDVSDQDAAWGVAEAFLNLDVGAVIGMQGDIAGDAAAAFSAGLYGALADGDPVDVALSRARQLVSQRTGDNNRDWALPALITRCPPESILLTRPDLPDPVRNDLQARLCGFIDRGWPRRHLAETLSLVQDAGPAQVDVIAVRGPEGIGKSDLVKWCVHASMLHGRNVVYVDLAGKGVHSFMSVLGQIADRLANTPSVAHRDRNKQALDAWRDCLGERLGLRAPATGRDNDYHREFPKRYTETAVDEVFTRFIEALKTAAGDQDLVLALDHVDTRTVEQSEWSKFLVERLVRPIALHQLDPIRMILVECPAAPGYLRAVEDRVGPLEPVELKLLPGQRFHEFVRMFLLHKGFGSDGVAAFLEQWRGRTAADWPPGQLRMMVEIARTSMLG